MNRLLKPFFALAVAGLMAVAAVSCGDDGENDGGNGGGTASTVSLQNGGLTQIPGGAHYELWAISGGSPQPAGKFDLDGQGNFVGVGGTTVSNGTIDTGMDLSQVNNFVLTVEPAGDTDTQPSASKLLAGAPSGGSATLSVSASAALGTDFASADGSFILATPTNGDNSNENSGIWFLNPPSNGGGPSAALTLPSLPNGWTYEGWTVINGTPVTTGKFDSPSGADEFDGFSGSQQAPPFPGEDYLMNAPSGLSFPTDLSGGTAVISVEPEPAGDGSDPNTSPFLLKPLTGSIPSGASDHTSFPLSLNSNSQAVTPTLTLNIQ